LLIKTLRGAALGGNVVASGSTVDFNGSKPRFSLRAKLDKIEFAQVMALRSGASGEHPLNGRGSMDLSADGQGLSWADVAPRVTGALGMAITDGKLTSASLGNSVVNPIINRLGSQIGAPAVGREMTLRQLGAQFRIDNGQLHTTSPIHYACDEGSVNLSGSIGLDGALGLTGDLQLSPKTISAATGGKLVPDRDIPVSLRIGGTLTHPEIAPADPVKTVAALTEALLRGRGADLLKNLGGGKAPQLPGVGNSPILKNLGGGKAPQLPGGLGNLFGR
jgi:hypothetical protein